MRTAHLSGRIVAKQEKAMKLHELATACSVNGDRGMGVRKYKVQEGGLDSPMKTVRRLPRPPPPTEGHANYEEFAESYKAARSPRKLQ